MKFIRLNKDTVRCILSPDDMKEYGLDIKDFMEQNEQATEFMHTLIEKAVEEIGYEMRNGMITLRVMQIPGDKLSITISDASAEDMTQGDFADKMESLFKKITEMEGLRGLLSEQKENGNEPSLGQEFTNRETIVLAFKNLDLISEYAKSIQYGRPIRSDLFKKEDYYLLVINKGSMAEKTFAKVCFKAFDFNAVIMEEIVAAFLEEHGDCLIRKKALSVMKKI